MGEQVSELYPKAQGAATHSITEGSEKRDEQMEVRFVVQFQDIDRIDNEEDSARGLSVLCALCNVDQEIPEKVAQRQDLARPYRI